MDRMNQEVSPAVTLINLEQPKRGRSRKDPSEKRGQRSRSQATVHPPPGFAPLTNNNTPPVDPINDPTQDMVGQVVTGVVQATFDAGYLLTVRIGNSNVTLTGAVFKPGHTASITPENDVAPRAKMIKRAEIPFPEGIQPKRKRQRRSKEKNTQLVTYVGNGPDPVDTNPNPDVLQLRHLSNNIPNSISRNQPAPHLWASLGKQVYSVQPLAVYPPNGSISQPSVFGDMDEPLFVEPRQTRHTVQHFQAPPFGGVLHGGTGRMTDLLNAVQRGADQVSR